MGNKSSSGASGGEDSASQASTATAAASSTSQGSWYAQAQAGYAQVVNAIIRPPRAEYSLEDLGPSSFEFCGKPFEREDLDLENGRGMTLKCSWWRRSDLQEPAPVVVAMHGNSSCRLCAMESMEVVLGEGCSLFSFDFSGSGQSGGDYVSLGFFEKDDLSAVIDFLRSSGRVGTIGLWGRSMGAATALLHGHRDPSIAAMVLDSPFSSLMQLATELVDKGKEMSGYNVPGFVVKIIIGWVQGSVKKKANFDIDALTPIADVDKCFIPALFVAGQQDDFILPSHSHDIHAKYAGDKNLSLIPEHLPLGGQSASSGGLSLPPIQDTITAAWARATAGTGTRGPTSRAPGRIMADSESAMMQQAVAASMLLGGGSTASAPAPATSTAAAAVAAAPQHPASPPDALHGAGKDSTAASGGSTSVRAPPAPSPQAQPVSAAHMTEEEMLAFAIERSMQEASGQSHERDQDAAP